MTTTIQQTARASRLALKAGFLPAFWVVSTPQDVSPLRIVEWHYDRLPWGMLLGAAVGLFVVFIIFRRIKYEPEELTLDRKVRKAFLLAVVATFLSLAILLLLDVYLVHDFGLDLTFAEAVSQVWLGWRTLSILVGAVLALYVVAVLFTRPRFFGQAFPSGRYALWPWPKPNMN